MNRAPPNCGGRNRRSTIATAFGAPILELECRRELNNALTYPEAEPPSPRLSRCRHHGLRFCFAIFNRPLPCVSPSDFRRSSIGPPWHLRNLRDADVDARSSEFSLAARARASASILDCRTAVRLNVLIETQRASSGALKLRI